MAARLSAAVGTAVPPAAVFLALVPATVLLPPAAVVAATGDGDGAQRQAQGHENRYASAHTHPAHDIPL